VTTRPISQLIGTSIQGYSIKLASVASLDFTGNGLKLMRVNLAADGFEFFTPTKGTVGLSNVDDTADLNKPISTATQAALDGKQVAGSYAAASHVGSGGSAHANVVAAGASGFMTGGDKTKLDGIATGASANSTDAVLLARANHTGTQAISSILAANTSRFFGRIAALGGIGEELTGTQATTLLDLATGSLKGLLSASDFTKLGGIASGATVNSSDATLLSRANHTGTQTLDTTTDSATRLAMTSAERTKLTGIATAATVNSTDAALVAPYHTLLDSSGSHIAARVAGTYGFGQGDPVAISGTGTLYPLNIIQISAADYPAVGALTAKLRVKATINCNDVAPGHNFVLGLHPITRPATSGGAGLCIYTIGAAVTGSTVTATTPAADSSAAFVSADFALPTDGQYVLGVVTNGTTATSAHLHLSAALQLHHA
jgi:hypothetical protein